MSFQSKIILKLPQEKLVDFEEIKFGSWFMHEGVVYIKLRNAIHDATYNTISVPANIGGKDFKLKTKVTPVNVDITVTQPL